MRPEQNIDGLNYLVILHLNEFLEKVEDPKSPGAFLPYNNSYRNL